VRALDAANNRSAFSNTATVTTPAPPDPEAPTTPSGLAGSAAGPTRVDLSWSGSTDNVGVTGYEVFRDGVLLDTATGTSFSDATASPSTAYSYTVRARDAAGNRSGFSNTAPVTTPAPPDTQAPTKPAGLTASASSPTQVDLSWTASNDNVGVTGYEIYRDGAYLATANFTAFSDLTAAPSTAYSYEVRAIDAAGNHSVFSDIAVVLTPPLVQTASFTADADARVEQANSLSNFGTDDLGADGGADPAVESYLRFVVTGITGPVQSAKLRVYTNTDTVDGPAVYTTSDSWTESGALGISWFTRPSRGDVATDDKGAIAANGWVEYDVTPLVSGDGTYDFVLATTSEDEVGFYSREQPAFAPTLVVTH
jgi:chitodextrinase